MNETPKANRIHIALFGRTNVGKSSFLNLITGQDVSITSEIKGTTTDVVEKVMELLPFGPVVFLDTAGLDDTTELAEKRIEKTQKVFRRSEIVVLIVEAGQWTEYEENVYKKTQEEGLPLICAINKVDLCEPDKKFLELLEDKCGAYFVCSSTDKENREKHLIAFKDALKEAVPAELLKDPLLVSDIVSKGGIVIMVVPIDLEAPKGRIILPQVQAIRDALDGQLISIVVKETELQQALDSLSKKPDLVVCDSQVIEEVCAIVPENILVTGFSVLYSRYKGDLKELAKGAFAIDDLTKDSKILIAESCTHHPIGEDIGRVKLPRWLKQYLGFEVKYDVYSGKDFPDNLKEYDLVIHCGACMFNRRHMIWRIEAAKKAGVPITNYGLAISQLKNVLSRALKPFNLSVEDLKKEAT